MPTLTIYNITQEFPIAQAVKAFFDPVQNKSKDYLSPKERFKGVFLPLAGQASLLAFSAGMMFISGGAAYLPYLVHGVVFGGALSVLTTAIKKAYKAQKSKSLTFDLTKTKDVEAFNQKYGHKHPHLAENYTKLCLLLGFQKPVIEVDVLSRNLVNARAKPAYFSKTAQSIVDETMLECLSEREIMPILAHEVFHIKKHHHIKSLATYIIGGSAAMLAFTCLEGLGVLSGVSLVVSAFGLSRILTAKYSQYQERQADRFAQTITGVSVGEAFIKVSQSTSYLSANFIFERDRSFLTQAFDSFSRITSAHPHRYERIAHGALFEHNNPAFCETSRKRFNFAASPLLDTHTKINTDARKAPSLELTYPLAEDKSTILNASHISQKLIY